MFSSEIIHNLMKSLSDFIFFYPLLMSIVWTMGALFYRRNYEREKDRMPVDSEDYPPVTILVPCHNEAKTISFTCSNLKSLNYLDYNVIFIDDASTDETISVLKRYTDEVPFFKVMPMSKNKGKAGAVNTALCFVSTPYVMILDADTILDRDALKCFAEPFLKNSSLAAVTGNPLPLNRSNFLSRFQTAEFMSIVGLIKRCQCLLGKIYTVSGCATMYKTSALLEVGGLSRSTATEDIDVTWKLQKKQYDIWFQPKAIAYIQVPTTLREYVKQRKRWALGGWHLLRIHGDIFKSRKHIKLWPVYLESVATYIWSFCFVAYLITAIINFLTSKYSVSALFSLPASILTVICIVQMAVAVKINSVYDKHLKTVFFWAPWYPVLFFSIGGFLVVLTSAKGLFGSRKECGKWRSPAREQAIVDI